MKLAVSLGNPAVNDVNPVVYPDTDDERKRHDVHNIELHSRQFHESDHPEHTDSQRDHSHEGVVF